MTDGSTLRPEMLPLPKRMTKLPIHRGYPVPWFVAWINGEPDFRIMDGRQIVAAVTERRCWLCGERLGSFMAFTIGPMCAVNRISAEPPAHRECALFAVRACPFLARPHMVRRRNEYPDGADKPSGMMVERNPGVALVWITKGYRILRQPGGSPLFRMGEPRHILAFARGLQATSAEIEESVRSGLPVLVEAATQDGPGAMTELAHELRTACALLGINRVPLPSPLPTRSAL